ncbi:MAG: hypothetical protein WC412_02180, partial [Candidatus Omnitrophota bacterium]
SVQGKLKDTADSLGGQYFSKAFSIPLPESGYRVSPATTNNNVGKLVSFHSSGAVNRSTTGFSYEGERGFAVSTSATHRSETGRLTATAQAPAVPTGYDAPTTQVEADNAQLRENTLNSSLNPGAEENAANVANKTLQWGSGSEVSGGNPLIEEGKDSIILPPEAGKIEPGTDALVEQTDSSAEGIYKRYNPEGNLNDVNE